MLITIVVVAIFACVAPSFADQAAVKCVQNELNALGYDAGPVDGSVGGRTLAAAYQYILAMKAQDPTWNDSIVTSSYAKHWCEKVAEAHPDVARFWTALNKPEGPTGAREQFRLGYKYDVGEGVEADPEAAVKWYLLAAEQGNAEAQRNLGGLYGSGRGVAQNDAEAKRWFRAAAEQGDAQAQYVLGFYYTTGDESMSWLKLAARQGHTDAIAAVKARS
ncbi:MAG: tetratricopeptide repeat protein [Devosia sp.]